MDRVYLSHGADPRRPAWFVVRRQGSGTMNDTLASLLDAGRTVYLLDAEPFTGRKVILGVAADNDNDADVVTGRQVIEVDEDQLVSLWECHECWCLVLPGSRMFHEMKHALENLPEAGEEG